MISHLRVWRQFWIAGFAREAAFRANFYVSVFQGIAQIVLAMVTFAVIYQFTPSIAGWTKAQVLVVLGIYRIVDGLVNAQVTPNMKVIDRYVETGELDLLLLRPVGSQFLVSTRLVNLPELVNVLIGIALTVYASVLAGVQWRVENILTALLFIVCGVLVLYALWFMLMTLALWFTWSPFEDMVYNLFSTARYPVDFFQGSVRAFLTFIVPAAFATTFPADALLGRADPRMVLAAPILACIALLVSHLFWNYALRQYSSASS